MKKKIALLASSLCGGGAERCAALMSGSLSQYFEVHLLVESCSNKEEYELCDSVIKRYLDFDFKKKGLASWFVNRWSLIKRIRKYIIEYEIDVIVGVGRYCSVRSILSVLGTRCRSVVWEHNNYYALNSVFLRFIRNFIYIFSDKIVLLTDRDIMSYPSILSSKIVRIYNPSNGSNINAGNRIESPKNSECFKMLHIGRFDPVKNQKELLDICLILRGKGINNFVLFLLGDGPLRSELEDKVETLGLNENIKFMGFRNDVANFYNSCHCVLLVSHFEGLPMVLIEAASHGVPSIAYDCPTGVQEIITHGYNGMIVNHNDKDDFVEKLTSFMSMNKYEFEEFKTNARDSSESFSICNVTRKWVELISAIT